MKAKVKFLLSAILLAVTLSFISCNSGGNKEQSTHQHSEATKYTCSMHPEVVQDKPGDCPKCGMALVEKKTEMNSSHEGHSH